MLVEPFYFDVESHIAARKWTQDRAADRSQIYHPAAGLARLNVAGACGDGLAVIGQGQQTIMVDVANGVTTETKLDDLHLFTP